MRFTARTVSFAAAALAACAIAVGWSRPAAAQAVQDHAYTTADIETGSRLYAAQCALCHGVTGDGVNGVNLRLGQFRRVSSDEDLARVLSTGVPGTGMPSFTFQPAEVTGVIAYIRAGFDPSGTPVKVGNPTRGQAVVEGKGRCLTCHRISGRGIRTAPDLSDIGAQRTPAALQRSLIDPTSAMLPINRPVRLVTRDGRTISGRRLNEDTFTVQLVDSEERLVSFNKADLREYTVAKTSTMPSAAKTLTPDEIADVVAYLLTLKGQ
jgi:putative heme-binding domain-containing protein